MTATPRAIAAAVSRTDLVDLVDLVDLAADGRWSDRPKLSEKHLQLLPRVLRLHPLILSENRVRVRSLRRL